MQAKDLGANCLGFVQISDPNGIFSSVEFFRAIFKVSDRHMSRYSAKQRKGYQILANCKDQKLAQADTN